MRTPFTATGLWTPTCVGHADLALSPNAEKLRGHLARGLIGSCVERVHHAFNWRGLTVYVCERHAAQLVARTK